MIGFYKTKYPIASVIILHGAKEHYKRYDEFIRFLNKQSINVYAYNILGHGTSMDVELESYNDLIKQFDKVYQLAITQTNKVYLFAHSFGTILARNLIKSGYEFDKVVLSAVINSSRLKVNCLSVLNKILNTQTMNLLVFDLYPKNWLSYSESNLKSYNEDKLCNYDFTRNSFKVMSKMMKQINMFDYGKNDCNFLIIYGEDDPLIKKVNEFEFQNTQVISYKNMKHEILNEENCYDVYKDIIFFYKS